MCTFPLGADGWMMKTVAAAWPPSTLGDGEVSLGDRRGSRGLCKSKAGVFKMKLQPCPFCGEGRRIYFHDIGCAWVMICLTCGAYGPPVQYQVFQHPTPSNRKAARDAWNRRKIGIGSLYGKFAKSPVKPKPSSRKLGFS